ncbi:MAG: hypothetical protein PHV99_00270 [Candidatus Pacebacteria bacterium]|nr:hypothetical protein [Candidatus Paceibacterota bacterium]
MPSPEIHDTASQSSKVLWANADISNLARSDEKRVSEEELLEVLGKYDLRNGLVALGRVSSAIFNSKSPDKIGKGGYRDPTYGVFITQFALAYLANILLVSRANDYKYKKQITDRQNILTLCNIYSNSLVMPELIRDPSKPFDRKDFPSLMVRMHSEQLELQFNPALAISRNIVIFTKIINEIQPVKFENLSTIFEREVGLTISEYFFLVMAVFACAQKTGTFRKESLTQAAIPSLKSVLTDEKVSKFLDMLSADYNLFKEEDKRMNEGLLPENTKTRFNPLQIYPIIKTNIPSEDPYVVPNIIFALKKGFAGLYWWFHEYFFAKGTHRDFRDYFGSVFESYVGLILKGIYGEENVFGEIHYKKGKAEAKFIDFWVRSGRWKVYLFEVKAYQFPLLAKRTGEKELLKKEVAKMVGSIKQMYQRIQDIPDHDELKIFRWKKLIPVIVFLDVPMVSSNLYKEIIETELDLLEVGGCPGIKKLKVYFLNIDELEAYQGAVKKITLEKIFGVIRKDEREGFVSVAAKNISGRLSNSYLDSIYKDFWKQISGGGPQVQEEPEFENNGGINLISGAEPPAPLVPNIENTYRIRVRGVKKLDPYIIRNL